MNLRPPIVIGGTGPRRTPRLTATFADEYNVPFASMDDTQAAYRRGDYFRAELTVDNATAPAYLEVRLADLVARVERVPDRDEVPVVCEEQLVVEHYAR